jgi:hypothetical protein
VISANLTPEPTAASPSVCGCLGDSLLWVFVGAQSPAGTAQLRVKRGVGLHKMTSIGVYKV